MEQGNFYLDGLLRGGGMALKFADVIPMNTVLEMFDKFHEQMTGESGYGYDEEHFNVWLAQRDLFIQARCNGIVDDGSVKVTVNGKVPTRQKEVK